uniref:Protein-lysine N-methyltransferase g.4659 n=1 Tax=Graphocephala atropunctata TaxID=36148 RepID=A0A1B6KAE0_9HEMI
MNMEADKLEELLPSELGTKEYWDSAYIVEIENFKNNGDVGEVWFGEESATRIIRWLTKFDQVSRDDPVIDVGCGNGMMLFELMEEGFTNLTGVDYSEKAIELANRIALERESTNIKFMLCDIVGEEVDLRDYKVVLDKGTYDAISLSPENAHAQRKAYKANLTKLLRPEGLFVIASCNWTEEELRQHFDSDFAVSAVIPAPKFQFGGKVGSSVTTLVFQHKNNETGS